MTEITSYNELIDCVRDRVGELGVRSLDFDDLAGLPTGLWGKVSGPSRVKRLGPEKMFDVLLAAGFLIFLKVDPEQTAKMQARIADNFNPRQANQARPGNSASPISKPLMDRVFGHFLREGRKKRWVGVSKKKRAEHARMMAMARVKKQRKRIKAAMKAAKTRKQRLALKG